MPLLACCSCTLLAEVGNGALLNVPVLDFALPIFDSNGGKLCEALGRSAIMDGDGVVHVSCAKLLCFGGEDFPNGAFTVSSDEADVVPIARRAFGSSSVIILGRNFRGSADSWEFYGDSKKIVAKKNVKVFLDGEIAEFLQ